MTRKTDGKITFGIIILLTAVFALAAAFVLSLPASRISFEDPSPETLLSCYESAQDASFDPSSGTYEVKGDDPSLTFSLGGKSFSALELQTENNEYPGDIPVSVYWTRNESEPFLGALSDTGVIKKNGSGKVYIGLPSYPVYLLRVDIDGDVRITGLNGLSAKAKKTRDFGGSFPAGVLIRFLLIFLVSFLSVLSLRGKSAREILCGKEVADYHGEFDLLRILATVFVIASHTLNDTLMPTVARGDAGYAFFKLIPSFTLCCNVLYILISGALLLAPSGKEESIGEFYKKRLIRVLLPMLCYYGFYVFQGYPDEIFAEGIGKGLRTVLSGLIAGRSAYVPHFWLIYAIIGLYIAAPFLKLMVSHMKEKTLFILILLIFAANAALTYLPLFGFYFGVEVSFSVWCGVFLLGYYLTTEDAKRKYPFFLACGVLGIAGSFLTQYFRPDLIETAAVNAPLMWMSGAGFFVLSVMICKRKSDGKKLPFSGGLVLAARSFAKYSYGMLLIHMLFMTKYILPYFWRYETEHGHLKVCMLLIVVVTFFVSYVFAVVYDNTAVRFMPAVLRFRSGTSSRSH